MLVTLRRRHGVSSFFSPTLESRFVLVGLSLTKTDPLAKSCINVQVALRSFLPPAHRRLANATLHVVTQKFASSQVHPDNKLQMHLRSLKTDFFVSL